MVNLVRTYKRQEDEIRCRINRALYAGNFVDIKNVFEGFLDYADLLDRFGNKQASAVADQIAGGYSLRAKILLLGNK